MDETFVDEPYRRGAGDPDAHRSEMARGYMQRRGVIAQAPAVAAVCFRQPHELRDEPSRAVFAARPVASRVGELLIEEIQRLGEQGLNASFDVTLPGSARNPQLRQERGNACRQRKVQVTAPNRPLGTAPGSAIVITSTAITSCYPVRVAKSQRGRA